MGPGLAPGQPADARPKRRLTSVAHVHAEVAVALVEAEQAFDQALRVAQESEVRLFLPLIKCGLGNLYTQRGEGARARDILLEAKREAEALEHATSIVVVSAYLGAAYAQIGEIQHGLSLVRTCLAGARQKGYGGIEMLAASYEASILASEGT